jgi:uncharacterized repeat protein (TIGR01451 family)
MKKIFTFLSFALANIGAFNAQVVTFNPVSFNDSSSCIETLTIIATIGSLPETGATIVTQWGDGSTSTSLLVTPTGDTTVYLYIQHGYAISGTYNTFTSLTSGTSGMPINAPGMGMPVTAQGPANCGSLYIETFQNSPPINYNWATYDFTGADGITTTIAGVSGGNANYSGLNIANTPYTVSINDAWLANNGLTQSTPDFTINSFTPSGQANPYVYTMLVSCTTPTNVADFNVNMWGSNFVAPLQVGYLHVSVCNYACSDTSNALVNITLPAGYIPNTSSLASASVTGNVLTFTVPNLSDCAQLVIPVTFPGATPAGTTACFYVNVFEPNEILLTNNNDTACVIILNSYDPNHKTVDHAEIINPSLAEELVYTIDFQNDGNFPAMDVVVRDTISANLDLSTFQVINSKHVMATSVNTATRVITFSFNNINLVASSTNLQGSQGSFTYKIKENNALPYGTEIKNTAYIYFDFNPAIVTNTTINKNITANVGLNTIESSTISMYPNPASTVLHFGSNDILNVTIYDLTGKIVQTQSANIAQGVALNALTNGLYQVVISTENGTSTQKLVVQK